MVFACTSLLPLAVLMLLGLLMLMILPLRLMFRLVLMLHRLLVWLPPPHTLLSRLRVRRQPPRLRAAITRPVVVCSYYGHTLVRWLCILVLRLHQLMRRPLAQWSKGR